MTGVLLIAFTLGLALTVGLEVLSRNLSLVDLPSERKFHSVPTPRTGGLGFLVVPLVLSAFNHFAVPGYFLAALTVIFAGGLWDDLATANTFIAKLSFQIAACLIFSLCVDPQVALATGFGPWLARPVIFLFLLFMTNAMNLMDNMNGLSSGLSLINLGALAFLAARRPDTAWLVKLLLIEAACVLAFYSRNFPRAKIFMGDQGSQLLGFFLTAAFVYVVPAALHGGAAPWLRSTAAGWIFFLPFVVDVTRVVVIRTREKRPLSVGDTNHLSHSLVKRGYSPTAAVVILKAFQFMSAGAVMVWVLLTR